MSNSESRQRPMQIKSRFTSAELTAIDALRGQHSRAGWLRNAALIALNRPVERPGRPGIPTEDIAAVASLAGNVGRVAGATVQLAKALRESGHVGFHALTEGVLADLRRQADALTTIIERLK
ncbi:hypothetical protein [Devosia sp. A369]